MGVKRRHFRIRDRVPTGEELSSSEESSDDSGEYEAKVPKIKEIINTEPVGEFKLLSLYKVIQEANVIESPSVSDSESRKGSDSDSGSDDSDDSDDSDSDSDSEESEEETPILRPVFISKSKRHAAKAIPKEDKRKEVSLQKLQNTLSTTLEYEKSVQREIESAERENLGDIDDTDNIDPEMEYELWKQREFLRLARERQKMIALELEEEEIMKRREKLSEMGN